MRPSAKPKLVSPKLTLIVSRAGTISCLSDGIAGA